MKMDTSIRVRTDRSYKDLYNQLRNVVVDESHELFFLCACLGFRKKKRIPLGARGDDRFWSNTIRPEEWCCYYSLILEENGMDFSKIKDDKKVIATIEEYANGGMEILIEDCMGDYLIKSDDRFSLDSAAVKDLPKLLLHYIYEESIRKNKDHK